MDGIQSSIYDYIEEVEKCSHSYRDNLKREKRSIETSSRRISELLNSFNLKDENEDVRYIEPMKISLPNNGLLDNLFREDSQNCFLFGDDREDKRKKLAAERRAEYNAYLEKKERELQRKRQTFDEVSTTTTPRSIMESVDYETILAKRKEEELKFRQINHAEPSLSNGVTSNEKITLSRRSITPENVPLRENNLKNMSLMNSESTFENNNVPALAQDFADSRETRYIPHGSLSSQENYFYRTGGGGEPVKDLLGNVMAMRGSREVAPLLSLPSYRQNHTSNDKSSYREELAKQIEEKKRLAELEKQKALELEIKIAQRIAEEQRRMQLDYENELKAKKEKTLLIEQERIRQHEEFKRKEEEMKQLNRNRVAEVRPKTNENINKNTESRSSSPPIPAVRSKIIFERVTSPEVFNEVPPVKPENVFSSLAEIRRKIMQDGQNMNRAVKGTYEVMNRRTVLDDEEDYDAR